MIPDSHDEPTLDKRRFEWAGKLIQDQHPTHVVHLGDHFDVPGAGRFDKGTLAGEGQRIIRDLASGKEALELLKRPVKSPRRIKWVFLLGNHEDRLDKFAYENPAWEGIISTDMLPLKGWDVVPFLDTRVIEGIAFSHYFPSGVLGKPIGGINAARSALLKLMQSCVWGHSHEFSYAILRSSVTGRAIHGLNAGCFFEHHPAYAGPASRLYTRGLYVLHNVNQGAYNLDCWGMDRLEEAYG